MEGNILLTLEESVYHIPPDQLRRTSQQDKVFVTITARAEEEREAFIPLPRFRPKMRILFRNSENYTKKILGAKGKKMNIISIKKENIKKNINMFSNKCAKSHIIPQPSASA